jgi:hypothetical protein
MMLMLLLIGMVLMVLMLKKAAPQLKQIEDDDVINNKIRSYCSRFHKYDPYVQKKLLHYLKLFGEETSDCHRLSKLKRYIQGLTYAYTYVIPNDLDLHAELMQFIGFVDNFTTSKINSLGSCVIPQPKPPTQYSEELPANVYLV